MGDDLLQSKLNQVIRVGTVVARDEAKMRVQVRCSDTVGAALVTDWLLVLVPRASGDMVYDLPDIGDQGLCLFLPNGLERGFYVGSMYGAQSPPAGSGDKYHRTFRDGSSLEYDRGSKTLTANIPGGKIVANCQAAEFTCESSFTVTAPTIVLNGAISTYSQGGGDGTVAMNGTVRVTQDVVADGISLVSHVHGGVEEGGGTTSGPQ